MAKTKKLTKKQRTEIKEAYEKELKAQALIGGHDPNILNRPITIKPKTKVISKGYYKDIYDSLEKAGIDYNPVVMDALLQKRADLDYLIKKDEMTKKEIETYEKEARKAFEERTKSEAKLNKVEPSIYLEALAEKRNLQDKNLKGYVDARIKAEKIMRMTPGMAKLKGQKKELELMKMAKTLMKEEEEKPKGPVFKLSGVTREKDKTTYDNAYSASMGLLGKGLRAGVRKIGEREDKAKMKLLIEKRKKTKPVEKKKGIIGFDFREILKKRT